MLNHFAKLKAFQWLLRNLTFPGRGRVVAQIDPASLPPVMKVRVRGIWFELWLSDWLQRHVYFGVYERKEVNRLLTLVPDGGVCVDVGANIGYISLCLAKAVGPKGMVHAFEPSPTTARLLRENVRLNPGLNVEVHECALTSTVGDLTFYGGGSSAWGTTVAEESEKGAGSFVVHGNTLDQFLNQRHISHVDILKVDIEGAELLFLKGAANALSMRMVSMIMIEYTGEALARDGVSFDQFKDMFEQNGFTLLSPAPGSSAYRKTLKDGYGNLFWSQATSRNDGQSAWAGVVSNSTNQVLSENKH